MASPPFEEPDKKKHEFPDAIALLSLEEWAEVNKTRILAVSCDRGWAAFAAESEWIVVDSDLASALAELPNAGRQGIAIHESFHCRT